MQLRSPQLEKEVRRGVREAIRSDPRLRAEARRHRRGAASRVNTWLQYLASQYFGVLVWGLLAAKAEIRMALAALAFWGLGSVATHAARFRQALYGNEDLAVLFHQPLTDDDVFSVQWTKFLRRSLAASSGILLPITVFALMRLNTWQDQVVLILLAPLWLAMTILLAVHLEAFSTRGWHRFLAGCFLIAIALLLPFPEWNSVQQAIVTAAWWLPPFGWFNYAFYYGVVQREWLSLSLFLPALAFVALLPFSVRKLRANYRLGEPELPPGEDLDLGLDDEAPTQPAADDASAGETAAEDQDSNAPDAEATTHATPRSRGRPAGTTAVEDFILAKGYMRVSPWWSVGWVERLIMRWFTPQQRLTAAFLGMPSEAFSNSAKASLIVTLIGLLLMMFLGHLSYGLAAIVAFIVLARVSGIHANYWPGIGSAGGGGIHPPLYAGYPLSLPTIAAAMLKANTLHTALAIPMLTLIGAIGAWRMGDPVPLGASIGLKIALSLLWLQPAFTAFHLANRVRWNPRPKWFVTPAFTLLFVLLIVDCGLGVAFSTWGVFLLLSAAALLIACAILGLVITGWKRGWYDLLLMPPSGND